MSAVKQEIRQQPLPALETCEEFVVGPAIRRQTPVTRQLSKVHTKELEDNVDVSDSLMDQPPRALPAAEAPVRKETISLLLDRSKKLREAMINSILETENTIKAAETLYDNKKVVQFHE